MILEIWNDNELMITSIWNRYKEKKIERILRQNIEHLPQKIEDYNLGYLTQLELENGERTINWVEAYEYFPDPDTRNMTEDDIKSFFQRIEEPYNYHCSFILNHLNDINIGDRVFKQPHYIFNYLDQGLGYWSYVVDRSLITFSPYSEKAKQLLEQLNKLE